MGWVRALPKICFDIVNTINKSTGFTPFQLCMGHSLCIIPPLVPAKSSATATDIDAWHVIQKLETDVFEAQDNLLKTKLSQAELYRGINFIHLPFRSSLGLRCAFLPYTEGRNTKQKVKNAQQNLCHALMVHTQLLTLTKHIPW